MKAAWHAERTTAGSSHHAGFLLAVFIAGAALLLQALPSLAGFLQWTRLPGDPSFLWRWLTGHLTHWSWNHLQWDLLAFAILSFMGVRIAPRRYAGCLALAAIMIPFELRVFEPQFNSYRGLSGLDSALFGMLVASLWFQPAGSSRPGASRLLAVIGGGCFLAKTLFELTTGGTLFVANEQREFVPVISSHLTGFLSGVLASSMRFPVNVPDRGRRFIAAIRFSTCRLRFRGAPR